MNIIKNLKTPKPFIASIIIACILVAYNIPILLASPTSTSIADIYALLILTTLTSVLVYLLSINKLLVRIITIPLVLLSSAFLYFILFYKIKIYPPVMTAIFETETTEAFELLSLNLILWLSIFGLFPSYLILKLTKNIHTSKKPRLILHASLILIAIALYFNLGGSYTISRAHAKSFKNSNPLLHPSYVFNKYLPFSYIYNTKLHLARSINYITQKKKDITAEHSFTLDTKKNKNSLFVLIIGESARSDRFSLNGYKKPTNPLLSKRKNVVSYTNSYSLGTSTMFAVPHIFIRDLKSKAPDEYKETSFLHVFKNLGFKTFWLSCYRSRRDSLIFDIALEADVTAYGTHIATYNSKNSSEALLYDHALFEPLKETLEKNKNGVIILHTKGSHGNYYHRVPKGFHKFLPTCKNNCLNDKLAFNNSYDNTIFYTDFFLNEVLNILKDKDAMFVYLSDHGESLGENGVFAHSAPFETAPKEQTHIPMIWWASDKFLSNKENFEKFKQLQSNFDKPVDQSYIFHSALDCMGVESTAINKKKSVCRKLSE